MGPRAAVVDLRAGDRVVLEGWAQRRKTAQALAMRARIVLKGADGLSATATAVEMKVCLQTVGKWRKRYAERGVDGLLDEPRPGQPRKITDADVERVLTLALESKPKAATHWSARNGQGQRHRPDRDQPHLAHLFAGPASRRNVQIIKRPIVHRQGARHRGTAGRRRRRWRCLAARTPNRVEQSVPAAWAVADGHQRTAPRASHPRRPRAPFPTAAFHTGPAHLPCGRYTPHSVPRCTSFFSRHGFSSWL
jgi:hypothetical protein